MAVAVRSEATLRWCEDEVRVDRRLWPPCTRVTSLKPTMQERLLGSALSQLHGRKAAKLKRTLMPEQLSRGLLEGVYRNRWIAWAHPNGTRAGTADPDAAGEDGAAVAQALSAAPESLGASISAIVSRAEFRTRIVDAAKPAQCTVPLQAMADAVEWRGESVRCHAQQAGRSRTSCQRGAADDIIGTESQKDCLLTEASRCLRRMTD